MVSAKPILDYYQPKRCAFVADLYRRTPELRRFMEHFTYQRLIEATLIRHYDMPESNYLVWEIIESLYPEGFGEFGDSPSALDNFDLLHEYFTDDLDKLLEHRLRRYELTEPHTSYLFHQWLDPTTMILTHYGYDSGI